MYGDLVVRFFLVSSVPDYPVMGTIMEEILRQVKLPLGKPVNKADAEAIVATILRQLLLRHDERAPINLRYTKLLTEFALHGAEDAGLFNLHPAVFVTAFNRLWYEIVRTSQHNEGDSWEMILPYATLLLDVIVCVPPQSETSQAETLTNSRS